MSDRLGSAHRADRRTSLPINQLAGLEVLVLDDLAAERNTEWVMRMFFALLNRRLNDQRTTIITADLDREGLISKFGFRTIRRLDEMCGKPVVLTRGGASELRAVQ